MKKFFPILFLLLSVSVFQFFSISSHAASRITALVTVTNKTVNGDTFTVNGTTRTWTNSVFIPSTQVLTNYTGSTAKTNLTSQIGSYPFTSVTLVDNGTNSFKLIGASDIVMTISVSSAYATVAYSTQAVAALKAVRVPVSGEPTAGVQNEIASGLVDALNDKATNAILQSSIVASNLVGLTNSQTIGGAKIFTNKTSRFDGIVSNSPAISGNVLALTNGIWTNAVLDKPTSTNATFYGSLNVFQGNVDFSGAVTFNGNASSITASDTAFTLLPENSSSPIYLGNSGAADGITVNEGYFSNTVTAASATLTNLNLRGGAVFAKTNNFPANADIAFARFPVTALANGNNAAVPVGTNVFIEVSGPSGAFTINGINAVNAQRDGKIIYIVNQTGQDMTIAHQSGTDPTAANRIITMTGADRATTGNGTATLIYSASASRWLLIGFDP